MERKTQRPPKGLVFRLGSKIVFSILGFLIIGQLTASAQQPVTVTGVVASSTGDPIPAATVMEKGTNVATVSDDQGKFSIVVANANGILVFSSVGYASLELPLNGRTALDTIKLSPASTETNLEEVVVVGYGTMRKSDLTGSISTAKGSDIVKGQPFNALEGLKGRAAGVNIFSNTGQPGGEMRVIIRGLATINASANPLYVVDG
ncbi:MAG TPA: carboxypeptidase-like regulatory domain-containing protein, partial [Niabella sp.]|nr:carboxypeptidase-like regulatory domain-containing protein [Niabella sp.]